MMRPPAPGWKNHGFTLVELLVSVAVIGVLVGLLLPAVHSAREASRRVHCLNNQKQLGLAMLTYESALERFPAGRTGCDDTGNLMPHPICRPDLAPEEKHAASGFVTILPHLELQPLFDSLDVAHGGLWNRNVDDLGWYEDPDKCQWIKARPSVFVCPSDLAEPISDVYFPVRAATTSYALVQGSLGPDSPAEVTKFKNDGMFLYVVSRKAKQIRDGLSHTMMIGEVVLADSWESSNTWSYALANADCLRSTRNPLNSQPGAGIVLERQNGAFGSHHSGGAFFCFVDGRVEFVDGDIDFSVYQSQSTIDGAELIVLALRR